MCRAWDILFQKNDLDIIEWRKLDLVDHKAEFELAFEEAIREFGFEGNRQAMYERYCG